MVNNSLEYAFADEATKTRLKADLAGALTAFERRTASANPGPRNRDPGTENPNP